ncbi:MAG: hypothetical protein AAF799_25325 [Myxococcota bacterium]
MSNYFPTHPYELHIVVSINDTGLGIVRALTTHDTESDAPAIELDANHQQRLRFSGVAAASTNAFGVRVTATDGDWLAPRCQLWLTSRDGHFAEGSGQVVVGDVLLNAITEFDLSIALDGESHLYSFSVGPASAGDDDPDIPLDDIKLPPRRPPPKESRTTLAPTNGDPSGPSPQSDREGSYGGMMRARTSAPSNGASRPCTPARDAVQIKQECSSLNAVVQKRVAGGHKTKH